MKNIILALTLAITSLTASAKVFELTFNKLESGHTQISTSQDAWLFISSESNYDVFIDKTMVDTGLKQFTFHAMTVFKTPQVYNIITAPVHKIYTYGYLRCDEKKLYLLSDWFVDLNEVIVYSQNHEYGSYVTSLGDPNSIRNDVYNVLCGESI